MNKELLCMQCKTVLERRTHQKRGLFYCRKCNGALIFSPNQIKSIDNNVTSKKNEINDLNCPSCTAAMVIVYSKALGFKLVGHQCKGCRCLWLSSNEFNKVLQHSYSKSSIQTEKENQVRKIDLEDMFDHQFWTIEDSIFEGISESISEYLEIVSDSDSDFDPD